MSVAFELRSDHAKGEDKFSGGSVSLPGGKLFNVGEALSAGKGKIVLNPSPEEIKGDSDAAEKRRAEENERARHDEQIIDALDRYPALKRAQAGADAEPTDTEEAEK